MQQIEDSEQTRKALRLERFSICNNDMVRLTHFVSNICWGGWIKSLKTGRKGKAPKTHTPHPGGSFLPYGCNCRSAKIL